LERDLKGSYANDGIEFMAEIPLPEAYGDALRSRPTQADPRKVAFFAHTGHEAWA
jgi:hypothetical protein